MFDETYPSKEPFLLALYRIKSKGGVRLRRRTKIPVRLIDEIDAINLVADIAISINYNES